VAELVKRIIDEAEEVLARLDGGAERVQSKRSAQ
jgi:hypothetical protein